MERGVRMGGEGDHAVRIMYGMEERVSMGMYGFCLVWLQVMDWS